MTAPAGRSLPLSAIRHLPKDALHPIFGRHCRTKLEIIDRILEKLASDGVLRVESPTETVDRLAGEPRGTPVDIVEDPPDRFSGCSQSDDSDATSDASTFRGHEPCDFESLLRGAVGMPGRPAVVFHLTDLADAFQSDSGRFRAAVGVLTGWIDGILAGLDDPEASAWSVTGHTVGKTSAGKFRGRNIAHMNHWTWKTGSIGDRARKPPYTATGSTFFALIVVTCVHRGMFQQRADRRVTAGIHHDFAIALEQALIAEYRFNREDPRSRNASSVAGVAVPRKTAAAVIYLAVAGRGRRE